MDSDCSLDGFLEALNTYNEKEEKMRSPMDEDTEIVTAPKLDKEIFCRFPVLIKNTSRPVESPRNNECKKCALTKKRLEEKIEKLELSILFQQDQLFEAFSHLKARVTSLEEKSPKGKHGSF